MSAYCRICLSDGKKTDKHVYATCNNCGSLVCPDHYRFWDHSKNVFCTICFPRKGGGALDGALDTVHSLGREPYDGVLFVLAEAIKEDSSLRELLNPNVEVFDALEAILAQLSYLVKTYDTGQSSSLEMYAE